MKIVFECSTPLPVKKYGGTERIIYWLMKELVRAGHEVTLIGHPDSQVETIGVRHLPVVLGEDWREQIPKDTDLIHLFYTPNKDLPCPHLVTIEGNGKPGEEFDQDTVFVSRKHAEIHGSNQFVYNGIDLDEYPYERKPRKTFDSFMFLGKAKWKVKNLDHCIEACKINKKHLYIAGGKPLSFSRYIHGLGMIGTEEKMATFLKCDALLWPVRWHEPFGIGMIEAMSQGLPVFGSPYGSVPEVVGEFSGTIVNNYFELESALSETEFKFDSLAIRERLEKKFSATKMCQDYLLKYSKILDGEQLNSEKPRTLSNRDPEDLLDF